MWIRGAPPSHTRTEVVRLDENWVQNELFCTGISIVPKLCPPAHRVPSRYEGRKPGENPVCPVFSSPTPGVPSLRPRRTAELRLAADAQAHHPPLPAAGLVGRRHHRTPCFTWRGSGARKRSTARRIKRAPPPPGRTWQRGVPVGRSRVVGGPGAGN